MLSPGKRFRQALSEESPLQLFGVINAYSAMQAKLAGFQAIYLSGAGVANSDFGLPDLGLTSLDNVLTSIRRITDATDLPLIVDADTGWGSPLNVRRTIAQLEKAGAAGCHIEDQAFNKRCGHRQNKQLVSQKEMCSRVQAAVDGKKDKDFYIIARTDALASEGMEAALARANAYVEHGADMIFLEAAKTLHDYTHFAENCTAPILANITEFGKTPLFTIQELKSANVSVALYPLSGFRAMNQAFKMVAQTLRKEGTQQGLIDHMQTRDELYDVLNYHQMEKELDAYLEKGEGK